VELDLRNEGICTSGGEKLAGGCKKKNNMLKETTVRKTITKYNRAVGKPCFNCSHSVSTGWTASLSIKNRAGGGGIRLGGGVDRGM